MVQGNDIHGSRAAVEYFTAKFFVYIVKCLAVAGGVIFLIGLVSLPRPYENVFKNVPDYVQMVILGLSVFGLFFPWFMLLYISRHLLFSIKRLERRAAQLETSALLKPAAQAVRQL